MISELAFHVGPYVYRAVVSDRRMFDEEGSELEGGSHAGRRLAILSPIVEPQRREEVLRHEIRHCWMNHVPQPSDEEEKCQLFAMISEQFDRDLQAAGGREMLERLTPRHVPHLGRPAPARKVPSPAAPAQILGLSDRVSCPCGAEIMCGSIHNGEPAYHDGTRRHQVERWGACDACGSVLVWQEVCTPDGAPLGEFVANPPPKQLVGREASTWVREHQEQAAFSE